MLELNKREAGRGQSDMAILAAEPLSRAEPLGVL